MEYERNIDNYFKSLIDKEIMNIDLNVLLKFKKKLKNIKLKTYFVIIFNILYGLKLQIDVENKKQIENNLQSQINQRFMDKPYLKTEFGEMYFD